MPDPMLAGYDAATNVPVGDELVANNHHLLFPRKVTLASGQNLVRGAVLGKVTASGKYVLSAAAAGDGSAAPLGVLVSSTDASAGDKEALIYERGDFNGDRLVLGAGHTVASIRDALQGKQIYLHKRYGSPV